VFAALAALFVLSGASGLVFELLWVRELGRLVGHTSLAVSLVVAAFLLGLVAGSFLIGRRADSLRRPLLAFAGLELLTGLSALGVTLLLPRLPGLLHDLGLPGGGPLPLRVALAFLVVLPPTFLMGGSLPVLVRFAARELGQVGRVFGLLYALNTLGAALGCGLAGFVLIGRLGMLGTACLAAGGNLLVGGLACGLHLVAGRGARRPPDPGGEQAPPGALSPARGRLLVGMFAVCGFVSIGYEVLWFRVLAVYLDSSAYAFSLLLATFLAGLVLGGLLYALVLQPRGRGLVLLGELQLGLVLTGLLSMLLLAATPLLRAHVLGWQADPRAALLGMLGLSALVVLPPATLIGVAFPLVVQLTTRHLGRTGRQVGLLYSVNTLGGIAGSLLMGFACVPAWGTQWSFGLLLGLGALLALGCLALEPVRSSGRRWLATAGTGLMALLAFAALPADLVWLGFTSRPDARLVFLEDGVDGPLSVLEYDAASVCDSGLYACGPGCRERGFRHQQLVFGAVSYANTVLPRRRYMAALALLPTLAHPDPRRALLVCFGTGTTAGAFLAHRELDELHVVDTNPDVLAAAPFFRQANHDALGDPRVAVSIADGRHFLLAEPRAFDIISLEPPPPTAAGVASLYSREFYELARARLAPGGVLAQWIPLDQQADILDRGLVAALLEVFPEVSLWIPADHEAVLLASDRPPALALEGWAERAAAPRLRGALREVGFDSTEALMATFVAGPAALGRWIGGARTVTDDWPGVEYFLSVEPAPFDPDALLAHAHAPPVTRAGPARLARLTVELAAARQALRSTAAKRAGRLAEARARVTDALALVGENAYLAFLRDLELGCLQPAGDQRL
jgi:spermidine synthase